MKVFFYGHAAGMGAGHYVRSLRLAEAALEVGARPVVTSGGERLAGLSRHPGVELLVLPEVSNPGLDAASREALATRGRILLDFLRDWRPDAAVVDLMALGLSGELVDTLLAARREGWPTRFYWGLPYAETTVGPVRNPRLREALSAYHGVLVYEEPGPMDPVPAYAPFGLPSRVVHVGVVTGPTPAVRREDPPVVVGLIGSGGLAGGADLLRAFLDAAPEGVRLRFVAGPLADLAALREAAGLPAVPVRAEPGRPLRASGAPPVDLVPEAGLEEAVADASAVVTRVGYNTAYTLMKTDLPVVLVPSTWPEQRNRAEVLSVLDGVWTCPEERLAEDLGLLLRQALAAGPARRSLPFRVDGARRAMEEIATAVEGVLP